MSGVPDGPVKIGTTSDVQRRLTDLQRGQPMQLLVALTIPGTQLLEHVFHRRLRPLHLTGEWYGDGDPEAVLAPARRFAVEQKANGTAAAVRQFEPRYRDLERLYMNGAAYSEICTLTGLTKSQLVTELDRMRALGFPIGWRTVSAAPVRGAARSSSKLFVGPRTRARSGRRI